MQESDELLQHQFEELSKGLQDEAPAVRITAASGICALLNTYWELVPAGTTAAYLKRLTGELTVQALYTGFFIHFYACALLNTYWELVPDHTAAAYQLFSAQPGYQVSLTVTMRSAAATLLLQLARSQRSTHKEACRDSKLLLIPAYAYSTCLSARS